MSYKDIIIKNQDLASVRWWPHYAYHYTDVSNAVSILESGNLYSRLRAQELDVMSNDNASRHVIDMTASQATSYVRFYFRPLTPTQYHNEGYKHRDLRYDGDVNANVPIPIFFFFYLEQLLMDPKTCFSEGSEAGGGSPIFTGEDAFSSLDFNMIYRNGPYTSQDSDGKKRETYLRHSEILYPDMYQISRSLAGIVCRNAEEKTTFLNLLKDRSNRLFSFWSPRIKVLNKDLYYNNGLFVDECTLHGSDFSITFFDAYPRQKYARTFSGNYFIKSHIQFEWLRTNEVLYRKDFELSLNYLDTKPIVFHGVPQIEKSQELSVRVFLDNHLMCYRRFSLLKREY